MPKKQYSLFKNTARDLDDLREILDGPISETLPDKPLTPSQKRRKIRSAFNCILSHLAILQTELETDARRNKERCEWLDRNKDRHLAGEFGNKVVISPAPLLAVRRILAVDKELKTVQDMFSEVLDIYETHFKEPWKPQRGAR